MRVSLPALLASAVCLALAPRAAAAQGEFHWNGKVAPGKSIEIKGVNGEIGVSVGRATWSDALEFRTVNGGITLDLPAGLSTEVRATTVNGDIQTDFPLMVTGRLGPRRLHGTIGSGGRRLALETVNGSIRLRKSS